MTPTELRHLLAHMSLSQCRAADWIGVDERTMRRWCAEEGTPQHRRMPEPAARLLRLLAVPAPKGGAGRQVLLFGDEDGEGGEKEAEEIGHAIRELRREGRIGILLVEQKLLTVI